MIMLYVTFYTNIEGLDVPQRYLDDLAGDLEEGPSGVLRLTKTYKDDQSPTDTQDLYTDHSLDSEMARRNFNDCKDSGGFAGCSITTPSPQDLSIMFVNRPEKTLNSSDIYNILPLCPNKYENYMKTLNPSDIVIGNTYKITGGKYKKYKEGRLLKNINPKDRTIGVDPYSVVEIDVVTEGEEGVEKVEVKNKYLHAIVSSGQYPGYTPNDYLDKIRYVVSDQPLPVNPDFFAKDGGTY